jgi:hypothetical protein
MATIWHTGPYALDLGTPGLAPQEVQSTFWRGWNPAPRDFTVTVTAHPSTVVPGSDAHASNTIWVSATSVQYDFSHEGDIEFDDLIIYADLTNTGPAAIRFITLYITFIQP